MEHQIAELTAVREDVLKLVEKWKAVRAAPPAQRVGGRAGVCRRQARGSRRPSRRVDLHREGLEPNLRSAITSARRRRSTRALTLSPGNPQAESLLGWALMLQDKFDDALLNFQKVLVHQPQNALARINVGYICLKKGIFGEAIEHLSRAIRLGNDKKATLYAHFYLGLVYLERDMFEDAQTFFREDAGARTEHDRSVSGARAGILVQRAAR